MQAVSDAYIESMIEPFRNRGWAYGSGFLSAHVLYAMIDCRSD